MPPDKPVPAVIEKDPRPIVCHEPPAYNCAALKSVLNIIWPSDPEGCEELKVPNLNFVEPKLKSPVRGPLEESNLRYLASAANCVKAPPAAKSTQAAPL